MERSSTSPMSALPASLAALRPQPGLALRTGPWPVTVAPEASAASDALTGSTRSRLLRTPARLLSCRALSSPGLVMTRVTRPRAAFSADSTVPALITGSPRWARRAARALAPDCPASLVSRYLWVLADGCSKAISAPPRRITRTIPSGARHWRQLSTGPAETGRDNLVPSGPVLTGPVLAGPGLAGPARAGAVLAGPVLAGRLIAGRSLERP